MGASLVVRVVFAALAVALSSCRDGDATGRCVEGRSVSCPCPGGASGAQTCRPDGTFTPCRCAEPSDAGAPADASPDSGPAPATDAGRDAGPPADGSADAGPECDESPCRLTSPQCGCPMSQGCYLDEALGRACAPAGAGKRGDPCDNQVDCAPGHACLDEGGGRWCRSICGPSDACLGGPGAACVLDVRFDPAEDPVALACTLSCEPVDTSGCPDGAACRLFSAPGGATYTDCREAGASGAESACIQGADCAPGLFCADFGGGDTRCTRYCRVGSSDCPRTLCSSFAEPVVLDGTEYGFCPD